MPPIPQQIRNAFASVPPTTTDENSYYGPVTTLLSHYFSEDSYQVCPQARPVLGPTRQAVDFLVRDQNNQPVIFIEVKAESTLPTLAARADADDQMRLRFAQLFPNCPLRVLYGVSLFGTKMCVYKTIGPRRLSPARIHRNVHTVKDISPIARYAFDICTINGSLELVRNMVDDL